MEPAADKQLHAATLVRGYRPYADSVALAEIIRESPEAAQWAPPTAAEMENSGLIHLLVCESEIPSHVVGFVCARQVADEAEILNIAVRSAFRCRGVGARLLGGMLQRLRSNQVTRVFLEVRESNQRAIALYEKRGFRRNGRRRNYYQNPPEDALVFEHRLAAETF